MRIRTARPEGADPCYPRQLAAARIMLSLPFRKLALHVERSLLEIDLLIEHLRMQTRHQLAVLQLQHRLGQPCDPRRRLQMSDVGLHRPQRTELPLLSVLSE